MTTASHPLSQECFHTACLFPSSFMISLWGLYFLGLCWQWLLPWFLTGGRHQQFLITPPLILPYSKTQLCLRQLDASLLPPSQRPSAPVLLPPLFFFLLPLLYLHQLFKAFGCCWIYNKPILQRQNRNVIQSKHRQEHKEGVQEEFFLNAWF